MKFIGITDNYNLTKEKITAAISVVVVIMLCVFSCFGVVLAMNDSYDDNVQMVDDNLEATMLSEPSDESEESDLVVASETTTSETTTETSATEISETTVETTIETTEETTETVEVTTTEATTKKTKQTTKETTKETTKATTKKTEPTIGEKKVDIRVYAASKVNLREGPGTSYPIVRQLNEGDEIDVVAKTTNGWYKTIKGNYINKDYTTTNKPSPTPTPKPTATKKPTPKPTSKPKATPTPTKKPASSKDGMTYLGEFKVTFYGPEVGTKTASGTTCKEGRTVAADWSVIPKGTKIYIENDPLPGGDGYYIVEDCGVKGQMVDIFAQEGESGKYPYTTRRGIKIYIVN